MFFGGPAAWFDLRTYNAVLERMLGPDYPEVILVVSAARRSVRLAVRSFAVLARHTSHGPSIGLAVYLLVCSTAIPRKRMLFVAVAPCVIVCIFFGQNGFFTSALLIGGLLYLDRRPILAGVLFGILTVKPQLGLLLPMVLLLERRWLTIASAVVTTGILVALTSMLFGWHIWIEFWQKVVPQQVWLTETGDGSSAVAGSVAVLRRVRMFNLPLNIAWDFQYIVSTCAFAAVAWTFWKRRDPAALACAFGDIEHFSSHPTSSITTWWFRFCRRALARSPRQHGSRPSSPDRSVDIAGDDDAGAAGFYSAGADRADRVRVPAAVATGAQQRPRSKERCQAIYRRRPPDNLSV